MCGTKLFSFKWTRLIARQQLSTELVFFNNCCVDVCIVELLLISIHLKFNWPSIMQ